MPHVVTIIIVSIIARLHSQTSYLKMALPAIVFAIVFTLPTYFMLDNQSCEKVNFSLAFGASNEENLLKLIILSKLSCN